MPEFSAQELDGAYEVAREIKQRLKALVEDANRLTAAQRESKVWVIGGEKLRADVGA